VIVLAAAQLDVIRRAAESAYPEECCGLLLGRSRAGKIEVAKVVTSPNVALGDSGAPRRRDRFEVDPEIRLKAMREAERRKLSIVGHYHSHPDHPPVPSAHDRECVFEPELVWLIVSVENGRAGEAAAYLPDEAAKGFRPLALRVEG
jgi:proteasome lid subunit RPN8/RPN11